MEHDLYSQLAPGQDERKTTSNRLVIHAWRQQFEPRRNFGTEDLAQSLFPLRAWTSRPSLSAFSKWGPVGVQALQVSPPQNADLEGLDPQSDPHFENAVNEGVQGLDLQALNGNEPSAWTFQMEGQVEGQVEQRMN